jgi:hypothetical protein
MKGSRSDGAKTTQRAAPSRRPRDTDILRDVTARRTRFWPTARMAAGLHSGWTTSQQATLPLLASSAAVKFSTRPSLPANASGRRN